MVLILPFALHLFLHVDFISLHLVLMAHAGNGTREEAHYEGGNDKHATCRYPHVDDTVIYITTALVRGS